MTSSLFTVSYNNVTPVFTPRVVLWGLVQIYTGIFFKLLFCLCFLNLVHTSTILKSTSTGKRVKRCQQHAKATSTYRGPKWTVTASHTCLATTIFDTTCLDGLKAFASLSKLPAGIFFFAALTGDLVTIVWPSMYKQHCSKLSKNGKFHSFQSWPTNWRSERVPS